MLDCIWFVFDKYYVVFGLFFELYGDNIVVVWCKSFSDCFKFGDCYVVKFLWGSLFKVFVDNYGFWK